MEKCEFECEWIEYLGLIISHNRVAMDPVKVSAVVEWPQPCNWKEVQSFLGFTNCYCRFVEGVSSIARPLFDLTKKDVHFIWTTDCKTAFRELRSQVTSAPILALLNDKQLFHVKADSSDFTSGRVLLQLCGGQEVALDCFSLQEPDQCATEILGA